jgi:hypothetical protein
MLLSSSSDSSYAGAPWIPVVASVLAGVVAAAWACPGPFSHSVKPVEAALRATVYVSLVGGVTGAVARLFFPAFFPSVEDAVGAAALSCAGNGVWFAPLAILIAQERTWAILMAAPIALAAARLLWRYGIDGRESLPTDWPPGRPAFAGPASAAPYRQTVQLFAAVIAAQAGVFALAAGKLGVAATLTGVGCFLVSHVAIPVFDAPPGFCSRRPRTGFTMRAGCAVALAALALIRIPERPVSSVRHARASRYTLDDEDLFSGVILAQRARFFKLAAPTPNRRQAYSAAARAAPPASIEFSGEYWILSAPMQRPPKGSLVTRATPITRSFTSVDRSPILMQARQRLPSAVDLRCCSAIGLSVHSTDDQPETIAFGLCLADSTAPRGPIQRLGIAGLPPRETAVLSFLVPSHPVISQFDELVVDIYLSGPRRHRSAKVAIERFVLVPRAH